MEARLEDRRVFELLRREDKHYLGGGDGIIFAPPLPLWLDRPGFWDGVHYFLFAVRPAFTVPPSDAAECAPSARATLGVTALLERSGVEAPRIRRPLTRPPSRRGTDRRARRFPGRLSS